jgi:hypothetical protein
MGTNGGGDTRSAAKGFLPQRAQREAANDAEGKLKGIGGSA